MQMKFDSLIFLSLKKSNIRLTGNNPLVFQGLFLFSLLSFFYCIKFRYDYSPEDFANNIS